MNVAGSIRATCLALALTFAAPSLASAQQWVGDQYTVLTSDPSVPRPTHHVVRTRMLITGVTLLALGYVGAVAWAAYYLDSIHLGPVGCNDTYAGWQFLPILGPVLGMGLGGQCVPDGLHFEEAVLPVVFSTVQLIGTILTIVGAVGRDVEDVPQFSLSLDANGGFASARWRF